MAAEPHILLLVDDPKGLYRLQQLLRSAGYQVKVGGLAHEPAIIAADHNIGLIILDEENVRPHALPLVNAALQRFSGQGILILTIAADDGPDRALQTGTSHVLRKPFTSEQLLARVKELFTQQQAQPAHPTGSLVPPEAVHHYLELAEQASIIILRWDISGRITYLNPFAQKFFGYTSLDVIGRNLAGTIFPAKDQSTEDSAVQLDDIIRNPNAYATTLCENRRQNGERIWVSWTNQPLYDESGQLSEIVSIGNAVTPLKGFEGSRAEGDFQYQQLVNRAPAGIYEIDLERVRMVSVNDVLCEYTGYRREELLAMDAFELLPADSRSHVRQRLQAAFERHKHHDSFEHKLVKKSGDESWVLMNARFYYEDSRAVSAVVVVYDISELKRQDEEQKRREAQINYARKMETVSNLAAGLAHKFNNALNGITGNLELLSLNYPADERINKYVERLFRAAHKMAALTNQLLAYARGGKYKTRHISLNDMVKETEAAFRPSLRSEVQLQTDLMKNLPLVAVDVDQLQMVLATLVSNAEEAIEGGGWIRITTCEVHADERFAALQPGFKPGHYACLEVEDNGQGMDEETRQRIFEPFFSTKLLGRGLAMASSYGVVKNHDGWIGVASEPGRGTRVSLYLPVISPSERLPRKEVQLDLPMGYQ